MRRPRLGPWLAIGSLTCLVATAASAQPDAAAASISFKPAIESAITEAILPGYRALAARADDTLEATAELCAAPQEAALANTREAFHRLVDAWSRVEMYRFGPAREMNRYERIFFWPDRRGLGLRQVRRVLTDEDITAIKLDSLRSKSVAVQGILALEYVLFGDDSLALADEPGGSFRCLYGNTIASAIALAAEEIVSGWDSPEGIVALMLEAGPDNPTYRSHGEVVQQFLQSAREQLQIVRDLKLGRPLGKSPEAGNPRTAPLWRSESVFSTVDANMESVIALMDASNIAALLPDKEDWLVPSLMFELRQARAAVHDVGDSARTWETAVRDPAAHQRLAYALIPLSGAIDLLEDHIPAALGLTIGFNVLDGD